MDKTKKMKVYLIAGEPSGDLLGSRLMRSMKKQMKEHVTFYGVGGETMKMEGLRSLFDISDLSIMGFWEIIPSIPVVLKHINEIVTDIIRKQPDIVMTIDSYGFSVRVHKRLKKERLQIPQVHCVAPQVWAWRKGRAKEFGRYIDHLFCLLPEEEKYFKPYGLNSTFIGHPVIEGGADKGNGNVFRNRYRIPMNTKVMCILPGSRKTEVKYLLPIFMKVAEEIQKAFPSLFIIVPTVMTVAKDVKAAFLNWHIPHIIIQGEKERYDAFATTDVALAASGTVSLELAMAGVPHIIAYKVNSLTGFIAKRLLKVKFVNLINILSNKEIIPEFLQGNCTVDKLVDGVKKLLVNPHQSVESSLKKLGLSGTLTPSEKMANELIKIVVKSKKCSSQRVKKNACLTHINVIY